MKKTLKHEVPDNHLVHLVWWQGFKNSEGTWEQYQSLTDENKTVMIVSYNGQSSGKEQQQTKPT